MSKAAEFCELIVDDDGRIACWVCQNLAMPEYAAESVCALGFLYKKRLIGGVVFGNYRQNRDIWLTIYTNDKHWCNRRILKTIFKLAFEFFNCRRVSILITEDNAASLSLTKRLGFRKEGRLRQFREDGKDAYVLGMLKEECNFL